MAKTLGILQAKHMKGSGTVSPHSQLGVSALDLESTPKSAPDHHGAVHDLLWQFPIIQIIPNLN